MLSDCVMCEVEKAVCGRRSKRRMEDVHGADSGEDGALGFECGELGDGDLFRIGEDPDDV